MPRIFAFGCVLYEMLTGRRAFDGKNAASVIAKILEGEPPPVRELQPVTPPALEHVLKVCLAWRRKGTVLQNPGQEADGGEYSSTR